MWERIIISLSYFCEKFRRLRARPANLCRQSAPTSRKPATTTAPCARTHSPPRSRATRTPPRACARRGMCLTATSVAFICPNTCTRSVSICCRRAQHAQQTHLELREAPDHWTVLATLEQLRRFQSLALALRAVKCALQDVSGTQQRICAKP